jgi:hypothetical protein
MSMLSPHVVRPRFFDLTTEEWAKLWLGAITCVALLALARPDVTLWPAMGLLFTALVFGHMCMTASRYLAFPDLIALAACVQWVVAPWLADSYPPTLPMFRNSLPADEYLPYALPATMALWVGLHLIPSRYLDRKSWHEVLDPLTPRVRQALDGIIVVGLLASAYASSAPSSLAFLVYLLASFRFFAALGWMVTQTPGWPIRVVVVFALLFFEQTATGVFYLVVHWGGYFVLVYAFMRRWRWKLGVAVLVALVMLGFLQQIKPAYREQLDSVWGDSIGSVKLFTSMVWDRVRGVDQPGVRVDFGDTLVRFNQGWIISRIMTHVPQEEPYASGQTIADAAVFSVVPRFLVPEKASGASQDLFLQFTGISLPRGTTMGLGIIGEMYANFSFWGGILSTFIYGLMVGGVFCFFARRALLNPLWWAVGSIVLLPAVEPGINLEDISNHVVKGAIVLVILWKLMPTMQRMLASPAPPDDNEDVGEYANEEDDGEPGFHDAVADHQLPHHP